MRNRIIASVVAAMFAAVGYATLATSHRSTAPVVATGGHALPSSR